MQFGSESCGSVVCRIIFFITDRYSILISIHRIVESAWFRRHKKRTYKVVFHYAGNIQTRKKS